MADLTLAEHIKNQNEILNSYLHGQRTSKEQIDPQKSRSNGDRFPTILDTTQGSPKEPLSPASR
ncbi:hypothetical protein [Sphingopyxis sp. BSNA05]|uniref:hypothetical protein n=1 Tax=Sphingopyxis sp. BSNA05 TaxID=1236614 RepID=UPI001564CD46|nr:hypothetical protein [Sphingopyxis sp. BSNA05]